MPRNAAALNSKKGPAKKQSEDKTFGMKNKKGKAAQKVAHSYTAAGKSKQDRIAEEEKERRKMEKIEKKKQEAEVAQLFKPVQKAQKCPPGVDPKSVLCQYFKAGGCQHGAKCIFSHDMATERKAEKRDIYSDSRDLEGQTMDQWDEKTLAEVVQQKAIGKPNNPTSGICNHFLQALDDNKYGWFWQCPNGDKCQYRHALPPGFQLKQKKTDAKKVEERPIEEVIEEQRSALQGGTKLNNDTFKAWREKIKKQKADDLKAKEEARSQDLKSGKVKRTGREILSDESKAKDIGGDEGEDAFDLSVLLREKSRAEELLDQENLRLAEKLAKEAEELAKDGLTEDQILLDAEREENERALLESQANTLQGVDTSVFADDIDEDLPEDDDDDGEAKNEESEEEK
eukprot:TRINITY_DN108_c0_g1_i1.p1 TRINITY_DN108_c0_g1~~TRINITY_DN108_c0_g1_i1.p1  ORF type:complete len:400 (+),score=163.27 TRINITY_DN108_c0_g1_i1:14-1213(+)